MPSHVLKVDLNLLAQQAPGGGAWRAAVAGCPGAMAGAVGCLGTGGGPPGGGLPRAGVLGFGIRRPGGGPKTWNQVGSWGRGSEGALCIGGGALHHNWIHLKLINRGERRLFNAII